MRRVQLLLFVASILLTSSVGWAADFVIVVNRSNAVNSISADDARNIFLGKKTTWPDGKTLVFVLQESTKIHENFITEVLERTPQQYMMFWKKAVFIGTGTAPKSFKNDAEVKEFVAANLSAVGYIDEHALDGSVKKLELK
jgi:ABC-type phosphate transport system substrate-binding protein